MSIQLNKKAVEHAKQLIKTGKYVADTDWSEDQPSAQEANNYLDKHGWGEYGKWFLAVDLDEEDDTKEHHKFPYGDFNKVHRKGLIAAKQRAAQNDYTEIEKAADELLEMIDRE
ncbi:MAG TPA: hypothetical protein VHP83_00710 [Aggregatilineaceae bacterium]|nr:hypothetical protein [Aggregatilineaceae bacterium]